MKPHQSPLSCIVLFLLPLLYSDGDKVCAMPGAKIMVFRSRIWDVNQKSLYLQNDELVAGYLQGPNSALEEKIYWIPNRNFNREKSPIILSIQDGSQCLASSIGARPVLQLEPSQRSRLLFVLMPVARMTKDFFCNKKGGGGYGGLFFFSTWTECEACKDEQSIRISDLYNDSKEDSTRFTFFRSHNNGTWRFESAAHPGWFLCTSSRSNEPIGLTKNPGSAHVIDFYFQAC